MYFNREENSGKYEWKLWYEEDDDEDGDKKEDEDEEE